MEVRITFRSEVFIKGDNMKEIKEKFEELPLYSADALENASADFCEVVSVEDAETSEDLENEFYNAEEITMI